MEESKGTSVGIKSLHYALLDEEIPPPRWHYIPRRWILLALSSVAIAICYMDRANFSVALIAMSKEFQWSKGQQGFLEFSINIGLRISSFGVLVRLHFHTNYWWMGFAPCRRQKSANVCSVLLVLFYFDDTTVRKIWFLCSSLWKSFNWFVLVTIKLL